MQEEFSLMLKMARKDAGLTQKGLADILGVAAGTVQQWELGVRFPRVAMLKRIEETLKIAIVPSDIEKEKKQKLSISINEAWKAAEEKEGRKLSFDEAMDHYKIEVATQQRIESAIKKLNNEGRRIAAERLEELTEIPKYTMPVIPDTAPPESANDDDPISDTPEQKKPPESEETPNDGK